MMPTLNEYRELAQADVVKQILASHSIYPTDARGLLCLWPTVSYAGCIHDMADRIDAADSMQGIVSHLNSFDRRTRGMDNV